MTAPAPDFDFPDEPDDDYNLITTERVFSRRTAPSRTRLPASLPRTGGSSLPSLMRPRPTAFSDGRPCRKKTAWHARRLWLEACLRIDEGSKRMAKSRVTSDTRSLER